MMSNRLKRTSSPYLQQHADNPVDWYPWGDDALQAAAQQNKPIFLSIGYSACHWCHVMAHESFEDPQTTALMNAHFVNIKVDREERPDLDSLYMNAVTAITGQGGWPLSVFLTPNLEPFFGGTYFPPEPRYNLPSFKEVLQSIAETWQNDPDQIMESSRSLVDHLRSKTPQMQAGSYHPELLEEALDRLITNQDAPYGGWGYAPKFPQAMAIEFLLQKASQGKEEALDAALLALDGMAKGGIYDVLGGGFARYATDRYWRVPHFEKMLYDNALLVPVYLHAWQLTQKQVYKNVVTETVDFILREMTHPMGGFYASMDADSEGVEGKYYIWTKQEIQQVLREDASLFCDAFGVTEKGNWEGTNILQQREDAESLAIKYSLTVTAVNEKLKVGAENLHAERVKRIPPAKEDKIVCAWNGLMLSALAESARVLENERYLHAAQKNATFLLDNLRVNGKLVRSWREGITNQAVFLEDYAALVLGLLALYQSDFDNNWYVAAHALTEEMINLFKDPDGGFFDSTTANNTPILQPKDMQDNATPSGNALAAEALYTMSQFSYRPDWQQMASALFSTVLDSYARYPTAIGRWLQVINLYETSFQQIVIRGDLASNAALALMREIHKHYLPFKLVAASADPLPQDAPDILRDKPVVPDVPTAYICEGVRCKPPIHDPDALRKALFD